MTNLSLLGKSTSLFVTETLAVSPTTPEITGEEVKAKLDASTGIEIVCRPIIGWVISTVTDIGVLSHEGSGSKLMGRPITWFGEIIKLSGWFAVHPLGMPVTAIDSIARSLPVFSTHAVGILSIVEFTNQFPLEYNSILGEVPTLTGTS